MLTNLIISCCWSIWCCKSSCCCTKIGSATPPTWGIGRVVAIALETAGKVVCSKAAVEVATGTDWLAERWTSSVGDGALCRYHKNLGYNIWLEIQLKVNLIYSYQELYAES